MRKAMLTDAFAWVCDSCGHMNYSHTVEQFYTEEEFFSRFKTHTPDGEGAYVAKPPSIVVCPLCRESFETELQTIEEFEEE
jgi:hypothetical protein